MSPVPLFDQGWPWGPIILSLGSVFMMIGGYMILSDDPTGEYANLINLLQNLTSFLTVIFVIVVNLGYYGHLPPTVVFPVIVTTLIVLIPTALVDTFYSGGEPVNE